MASYNLENLKFLIVEDNGHWQQIVRTLFAGLGAKNVRVVPDCKRALEELELDPPDIVICDWMMAEMSGIELVRRLRNEELSPNPFIPIILLTAHTERHRVEEARDAGVHGVLTKPVSPKSLYDHIVEIIEHPRQFVRTETYFGPDRRRKADPNYKGPERRQATEAKTAVPAPGDADAEGKDEAADAEAKETDAAGDGETDVKNEAAEPETAGAA